jgi:hypothetical protein
MENVKDDFEEKMRAFVLEELSQMNIIDVDITSEDEWSRVHLFEKEKLYYLVIPIHFTFAELGQSEVNRSTLRLLRHYGDNDYAFYRLDMDYGSCKRHFISLKLAFNEREIKEYPVIEKIANDVYKRVRLPLLTNYTMPEPVI